MGRFPQVLRRLLLCDVSCFFSEEAKSKRIPNPFTEAKYQYSLEEKEKKKKKKLYQKNIGEATVTVKASAVGIRHALCLLCNLINSLT